MVKWPQKTKKPNDTTTIETSLEENGSGTVVVTRDDRVMHRFDVHKEGPSE